MEAYRLYIVYTHLSKFPLYKKWNDGTAEDILSGSVHNLTNQVWIVQDILQGLDMPVKSSNAQNQWMEILNGKQFFRFHTGLTF